MTVRGIICLAVDAILLVLALGSSIRELVVIALFLGVFLVFSMVSLGLALLTLNADGAVDATERTRGEEVEYRFTLRGPVLLPVTGHVTLLPPGGDKSDANARHRHAFVLHPTFRWKTVFSVTMPCAHRGRWTVVPESLRLRDVFGLFSVPLIRRGRRQPLPVSLSVFPQVFPFPTVERNPSSAEGFNRSLMTNAINGELFGDTREQRPGDPIKRIHWKQSARMQKLFIRQYEAQENAQILLLMDAACADKDVYGVADIATEITASLAQYGAGLSKSVQVIFVRNADSTFGEDAVWLHNGRDFPPLLEALTDVPFTQDAMPLDAWQLRDPRYICAGSIWVITDNPSDALIEDLEMLSREGRQVGCFIPVPVTDEAQEDAPAASSTAFRPIRILGSDEIIRKVGDLL